MRTLSRIAFMMQVRLTADDQIVPKVSVHFVVSAPISHAHVPTRDVHKCSPGLLTTTIYFHDKDDLQMISTSIGK